MSEFSGKTILITGGTRGLGWAIACAYAREGAKIVIAARTESELKARIDEFVKQFRGRGKNAIPVGKIYAISGLTREGCEPMLLDINAYLESLREPEAAEADPRFDQPAADAGALRSGAAGESAAEPAVAASIDPSADPDAAIEPAVKPASRRRAKPVPAAEDTGEGTR